jgi:hypothetical protein
MYTTKKSNPMHWLLYIYLLTYFLPIIKGLPLTPIESFYIPFWLILGLFFGFFIYTNIFFVFSLFFVFIDLFYRIFDIYKFENDKVFFIYLADFFGVIFIPISFFNFVKSQDSIKLKKNVFQLIISCISLTTISSIIVIQFFPQSARIISSSSTEMNEHIFFLLLNLGGYSFAYLIALTSPLYYIFYSKERKIIWLFLLLISFVYIIFSQLFGAIIIFSINLLILLFVNRFNIKTIKMNLLLLSGVVIFFNFLKTFLATFILAYLHYFQGFNQIYVKTEEIISLLLEGEMTAETQHLLVYKELREESIQMFLNNPIFGGDISAGHNFWIDYLARFGIIGLLPYIFILVFFILYMKRLLKPEFFVIYINTVLLFISIGLSKNIISSMPFIIFFVIPFLLMEFQRQNQKV